MPSEAVLLLAVDLPVGGAAARRAALPFAVEDHLAEPLDAVHVVLGAALGPATWLAAVVRHDVLAGWVAALADAGLDHVALVPEALALPPPAAGSWHVAAAGERRVVRTAAGGFATCAASFPALWAAGGAPPCTMWDGSLDDLPADARALATVADAGPDLAALAPPPLDLRTGPYAAARPVPRALRRVATAVGLGLLAHTALLAADARAAQVAAAHRRTTTEALLRATLPGTPLSADVDRLLPGGDRDRLLPLLARVAGALAASRDVAWTRLAWTAADGSLTLGIEGADLATLQRVPAALAAAGLHPASGTVTAAEGHADGDIVVRGAP